jgi:chromosome segregation protein
MDEEFDKNYKHYDNERLIERLKIRIEELGILDPTSIRNNFEELKGRDEHLGREIEDLNKTKLSLDTLILELESSIKNDFTKGLEKINFAFNNYFHEVFSGGKASLIITKNVESDEGEDGDNNFEEVEGVDISINLPSKKVNDINMLSGGERTLSSIALLFAMTSIIPPPFMVLDETDAALDELNARKYGKMLGRLSEKSRLLVITHNRETMNECDVLYGVTMGQEGFSRLLSIKFDK